MLFTGPDSPFARRPASTLAWLDPLDPQMIVLDAACGAAHAAEIIAPQVRQVIGLDITPSLLALGAQRLRDGGHRNVLLQEGSVTAMPFVDDSFDLVVCRSSVHHFSDPARAIGEMGRVCRPGGRVVISDLVPPSIDEREALDRIHRAIDPSHVRILLEQELADLMRELVGPLTYGETAEPLELPIDSIFTDASDRVATMTALDAELHGGPPTGLRPQPQAGRIIVAFTNTVVHATVPAQPRGAA